jgi:hypothetical protein
MFFELKTNDFSHFNDKKRLKINVIMPFLMFFLAIFGLKAFQLYQLFHLFRGTLIVFYLPVGIGSSATIA